MRVVRGVIQRCWSRMRLVYELDWGELGKEEGKGQGEGRESNQLGRRGTM